MVRFGKSCPVQAWSSVGPYISSGPAAVLDLSGWSSSLPVALTPRPSLQDWRYPARGQWKRAARGSGPEAFAKLPARWSTRRPPARSGVNMFRIDRIGMECLESFPRIPAL
ncbi:hypothetical protein BP6252_05140 [Coleophoma cylindrospora]|uniref:Uncharacterized protein n=1 Tax=Coleophoma cylindrospora TaxID=1849047 RepID=A0A3D8RSM6_9HELO|nr:hypothetical protein BP6252_05140 [Coleophoma cylindrospora]